MKPYQPMDQDPRDRLRQQACQRGLKFLPTAATAARHRTWDSQKQMVRLKRVKRHCYWHEYILKVRGNDGSMKHAFIFASDERDARERAKIWSAKESRSALPKANQAPGT